MDVFCILLRGVNVTGKNLIKMADLKARLGEIGLCNVQTYIQSGNITFTTVNRTVDELEGMITNLIFEKYGYNIKVWVMNRTSFGQVYQNNPFIINRDVDNKHLLVSFLADEADEKEIMELNTYALAEEEIVGRNKQLYLYFPNGYGISKLSNNFIEKKLKTSATTRNWNTIIKLDEMLETYN